MATSAARKGRQLDVLADQVRVCVQCPLHASRTLAVPGDGKPTARVMVVGEGPGRDEDKTGLPFVGASGRFLNLGSVAVKKLLGAAGVTEVRGRVLDHSDRKFFVTYHPAVRFYRDDLAARIEEDFAVLREELKGLLAEGPAPRRRRKPAARELPLS